MFHIKFKRFLRIYFCLFEKSICRFLIEVGKSPDKF